MDGQLLAYRTLIVIKTETRRMKVFSQWSFAQAFLKCAKSKRFFAPLPFLFLPLCSKQLPLYDERPIIAFNLFQPIQHQPVVVT